MDFPVAIFDRMKCQGHQLNLGAVEACAGLKHAAPVHRFMALLSTDTGWW